MTTLEKVTFRIRKAILNDNGTIRKYKLPIDHWFHIETGVLNEDGEELIILVAEDHIVLGYRDSNKPFLLEYKFYMIDDLSENKIEKIINEIKEKLQPLLESGLN